jgi:hypothetical protein
VELSTMGKAIDIVVLAHPLDSFLQTSQKTVLNLNSVGTEERRV